MIYLNAEENYQKALDRLCLDCNNSLSTYIPNSDISRINNGDTSSEVDNNFIEVFNKSKKIYEQTNGFFDPTVVNLINAYGFGPKNKKNEFPASYFDAGHGNPLHKYTGNPSHRNPAKCE